MSKDVDEKIVKMSLDNSSFLSKIRETLSSITGLNSKLSNTKNIDLGGSVRSVDGLKGAVNSFSTGHMSSAVDNVKSHFSALQVVAVSALATIVSKATSAGLNLLKSISFKPMMEGFDMYSNKMKTIQVIQANTGASTKTVNGILNSLNDYANKTVYSFEDMTTNLGTFTAAGVGLKTAKIDMIGLSNLAATSGSNTQQAAMAMYQLSQAIAAGHVGLQDWNSVVNAGMGGKKFQQALMETGKEMGKNIKTSDNFRNSLQKGWLTSDVLNRTLAKFASDKSMLKAATQAKTFADVMDSASDDLKSGWSQTFTILFGGFSQSAKLWTGLQGIISNMVTDSAKARNETVKGFVELGGKAAIIDALRNSFNTLSKVVSIAKEAFHDVFPQKESVTLANIAIGIDNLTKKFILNKSSTQQLKEIFTGLFSAVDILLTPVRALISFFSGLLGGSNNLGGGLLGLLAHVGQMITSFDQAIHKGKGLQTAFDTIRNIGAGTGTVLSDVGGSIIKVFSAAFNGLKNVMSTVEPLISKVFGGLKKALGAITGKQVAGAVSFGVIIAFLKDFKKFSGSITTFIDKILGSVNNVTGAIKNLNGIREALEAYTKEIQAKTLMEIAAAVGILAVSMKLISTIPASGIAKGLETIAVSLVLLVGTLKAVSALSFSFKSSLSAVTLILTVSSAIMQMSVALKILSTIKPERIGSALTALAGSLVIMVAALAVMAKIKGPTIATAASLTILADGLLQLSVAMKVLSTISWDGILKGLTALGAILTELALFTLAMNGLHLSPATAIAVGIITTSIVGMSVSVIALSALPFGRITQGLIAMGTILGEIVVFSHLITNAGSLAVASVGIIGIAAAIAIMTPPLIALGVVPFAVLAKGLIGMAVALGEVVLAMKFATGSLAGAASITLVAVALNLLIPPLVTLSAIPVKNLAAALIALATALTIIVAAAIALNMAVPALLAFAAALTAISLVFGAVALAATAIGLAFTAFASAMVSLASLTASQVNNIVASMEKLILGIGQTVLRMVPLGVQIVVAFITGIAGAIPQIASAGLSMIAGLLGAIAANIGKITVYAIEIVVNFANALASQSAPLIAAGLNLILSLMNGMANGIRQNGPQLVSAALNIVESILEVMVTGLTKVLQVLLGWIPGFTSITSSLGGKAKEALRSAFQVTDVGQQGGQGFVNGVNSKSGSAHSAGKNLADNAHNGSKTSLAGEGAMAGGYFASGLGGKAGNAHGAGKSLANNAHSGSNTSLHGEGSSAGTSFGNGLGSGAGHAHSAGRSLASSGKSGAGSQSLHGTGYNFGIGFGNGIGDAMGWVISKAASLASSAVKAAKKALDSHSPSRVMMSVGNFFSQGFANGIAANTTSVDNAKSLAVKTTQAVTSGLGGLNDAINNALNLSPTITPVLDTSNLRSTDLSRVVNSNLNAATSAQTQTTPIVVKMDTTSLEDKISAIKGSSNQPVQLVFKPTIYGNLDYTTAYKWADILSEALEKKRTSSIPGGAF